jgi:DNA-binding NarL/FixJ family response regulator
MGSPPWVARIALEYAEMLARWLAADDGSPTREAAAALRTALLERAVATARELGMARVESRALAALGLRSPAAAAAETASPLPVGLTAREAEVLQMLATGATNREIADRLVLSVRTVERHIANLYDKIGAHSKAEATAFAVRQGIA